MSVVTRILNQIQQTIDKYRCQECGGHTLIELVNGEAVYICQECGTCVAIYRSLARGE